MEARAVEICSAAFTRSAMQQLGGHLTLHSRDVPDEMPNPRLAAVITYCEDVKGRPGLKKVKRICKECAIHKCVASSIDLEMRGRPLRGNLRGFIACVEIG